VRYQQICPVSLASEVLAERWTPLILREIVLFDRHRFSEIQHGVGHISQSLLAQRLRTLERAGIVEHRLGRGDPGSGYYPTQAGRELETVLNQLGIWAQHWIELRQEHCDAAYLMQTLHAILRPERLPQSPTTVRFEFAHEPKVYWLVLDGPQPELCYNDPGREVDLLVTSDEQALGAVLLGRVALADAMGAGLIALDGEPKLVRDFPSWLGVTRFARYATDATRTARAERQRMRITSGAPGIDAHAPSVVTTGTRRR